MHLNIHKSPSIAFEIGAVKMFTANVTAAHTTQTALHNIFMLQKTSNKFA